MSVLLEIDDHLFAWARVGIQFYPISLRPCLNGGYCSLYIAHGVSRYNFSNCPIKLYLKFKTSELYNAVSAVNSDLNEICMWCCHNSLLLNPDKTKLLVVGVPQLLRQLPDFTITLCGKPISPIPVAKDLGVFIDQYLSYDEHIRKTVANFV